MARKKMLLRLGGNMASSSHPGKIHDEKLIWKGYTWTEATNSSSWCLCQFVLISQYLSTLFFHPFTTTGATATCVNGFKNRFWNSSTSLIHSSTSWESKVKHLSRADKIWKKSLQNQDWNTDLHIFLFYSHFQLSNTIKNNISFVSCQIFNPEIFELERMTTILQLKS